jgi:hypothetical protein
MAKEKKVKKAEVKQVEAKENLLYVVFGDDGDIEMTTEDLADVLRDYGEGTAIEVYVRKESKTLRVKTTLE